MLDSDSGSGISIPHPHSSKQDPTANFSMPPVVVPSLNSSALPPNLTTDQITTTADPSADPTTTNPDLTTDSTTVSTDTAVPAADSTAAFADASANSTASSLDSFETAIPTSLTMPPVVSPESPKPSVAGVAESPRPAVELSNPMAPRALFESEAPSTTPSVAFNDPASSPDAPRSGVDPNGKQQGIAQAKLRQLEHTVSPRLKDFSKTAKANPMRTLLIVSSSIIVILIIAIALVS